MGGGGNKCLDLPGGQSANYTALEVAVTILDRSWSDWSEMWALTAK